jgi:Na+/proline symporter
VSKKQNKGGKNMKNRIKYVVAAAIAGFVMGIAYYYPAEFFIAFTAGWLFGIPAAFLGYIVYGLFVLRKERKNRIEVVIKPTEAMRALARREAELQKEKEILLEEAQGGKAK